MHELRFYDCTRSRQSARPHCTRHRFALERQKIAWRKDQIAHYVFGFIARAQCRRRRLSSSTVVRRRAQKVIFNSGQLLL